MKHCAVLLAFIAVLSLSGCETTAPTTTKEAAVTKKVEKSDVSYEIINYPEIKYTVLLDSVMRPKDAATRYGELTITPTQEEGVTKYLFEDKLVSALWIATDKAFAVVAKNKTDHSMKIVWDEAAFVDTNGTAHRVAHTGVRYLDMHAPQPPSVIPASGSITDLVFSVDSVSYSRSSGWENESILPSEGLRPLSDLTLLYDFKVPTEEEKTSLPVSPTTINADIVAEAQKQQGRTMSVLLPIEVEGVTNEYTFNFKVASVDIKLIPLKGQVKKEANADTSPSTPPAPQAVPTQTSQPLGAK